MRHADSHPSIARSSGLLRGCQRAMIIAVAVASAVCAGNASGRPLDDIEVMALIRQIQTRYTEAEIRDFREARMTSGDIIRDAIEPVDLGELTPSQVSLLAPFLSLPSMSDAKVAEFMRSVERAGAGDDAHALIALLVHAHLRFDPENDDLYARILAHPAMHTVIQGWFAMKVLNLLASPSSDEFVKAHLADYERVVRMLDPNTATKILRPVAARLLKRLEAPGVVIEARATRQRIHAHLLSVARGIVAKYTPLEGSYTNERAWIDQAIDLVEYLEGPGAVGSLVGLPAPGLDFLWWNGPDAHANTLDDLRGRIVVLDFWATWCGPCVAAFPKIRDLHARYSEKGVVVVGVTSVQGWHVEDGEGVSLKGENAVERELQLMTGFMQRNAITWNIAFSTRPVTEPRYEVWGIPHYVIIDANGVVRHNGLHDTGSIAEALDALLAEGGAPVPAAPR